MVQEDAAATTTDAAPVSDAPQSSQEGERPGVFERAKDAASRLTEGITGGEDAAATKGNANQRPYREPPTPRPTVYVGNLFFDVTENDLKKNFEKFGTVTQARLIRDARGLSKG